MPSRFLRFTTEPDALRERMSAAMLDYIEGTGPHPFTGELRIWNGQVIFEVVAWNAAIQLNFVQALYRGQGHGSLAIEWLKRIALERDLPIHGNVQRVGGEGLTVRQLQSWYRRHGFRVSRFNELTFNGEKHGN